MDGPYRPHSAHDRPNVCSDEQVPISQTTERASDSQEAVHTERAEVEGYSRVHFR